MANLNLEGMRKQIYKTYFSDGIWDIILGVVYLIFGLGALISQDFWYLFPIIMILPLALKRSVSEPRIGALQFKKSQKNRLVVLYFLFIFFILGFVVFLGILNPSGGELVRWLTHNLFLVIGLVIAIILGLIGWMFTFSRMYLYAILNLLGFALVGRITSAGVILTLLGGFFSIIGLIVFFNFLKYNPKIKLSENEKSL